MPPAAVDVTATPGKEALVDQLQRRDRELTVAVVLLFALFPLLPVPAAAGIGVATVFVAVFAWVRRLRHAAYTAIFCSFCFAALAVGIRFSQIWLGLAIAAHAVLVLRTPWLGDLGWNRRGSLRPGVLLLCVAAAAVAGVALLGWFVLLRPDVADIVKTFVPDVGLPLLVVGGLLFSMVNAAVEEIAYRGIMMHALEQALGRGAVALGLQALAFGTLHIHGFPRGWIGVCLATIYGLMIGVVRVRAGGIFAPWLAHVLTDMAIVGILVILVL